MRYRSNAIWKKAIEKKEAGDLRMFVYRKRLSLYRTILQTAAVEEKKQMVIRLRNVQNTNPRIFEHEMASCKRL
jgi:hypothetical protein